MAEVNNSKFNQACKDYFQPKKLWNDPNSLGKIKAVGAVISYFTVIVPIFMKLLQICSSMYAANRLKNKVITPVTKETSGTSTIKTTNSVGLSSIQEKEPILEQTPTPKVVTQTKVTQTICPFRFDGSMPLTNIYSDDKLRNDLRSYLNSSSKAKEQFEKGLRAFLNSYVLGKSDFPNFDKENEKPMENLKEQIVAATLKNINETTRDQNPFVANLGLNIKIISTPATRSYFNDLLKNQVIGGWGSHRTNSFILLAPISATEENNMISSMDGSYYIKVDSKIHVKHFEGKKIVREEETNL